MSTTNPELYRNKINKREGIMRQLFILRTILLVALLTQSCGTRLEMVAESVPDVEGSVLVTSVDVAHMRSSISAMDRPPVSYLEEYTPACALAGISGWDTCPNEPPTIVDMVSVEGMGPMWPIEGGVPTLTEIMLGQGTTLASVHLVVRGVVQKSTTRCIAYPIKVPNYMNETSLFWNFYHYHCFSEIAISEYIVGTGPATLTVSLHRETLYGDQLDENNNIKEEILSRFLEYPESRTATAYEGKELILFLIPTVSTAVEGWQNVSDFGTWFLQKTPDDNIRVISADIVYAETDEQRNQLNRPLGKFVEQIKQAINERNTITGGKVGTYPSTLPAIVTDANFLQNYYISVGAVYDETADSTVLPPPVPGENDPAPPTVPANEATTTTSVLIPGEEAINPPTTDDAEISTTTSTTTTTVETPIIITTTTTISDITTTTQTAETTTTTEATVAETATGTTTTTTEPPSEDDDSTEEPTTTTRMLPSADGNPSEEGISPDEENNPSPGVSPPDDDVVPEDDTATIPPGEDSDSSPADNQGTDDEQTG